MCDDVEWWPPPSYAPLPHGVTGHDRMALTASGCRPAANTSTEKRDQNGYQHDALPTECLPMIFWVFVAPLTLLMIIRKIEIVFCWRQDIMFLESVDGLR